MDVGRSVLRIFGLLVACSFSFVAGAATEFIVPPSYLEALAGVRPIPREIAPRRRPVVRSLLQAALSVFVPKETILVLGSSLAASASSEPVGAQIRTQSILLVGVRSHGLNVLSIPPHTVCSVPDHGRDRLAAVIGLGGPHLALQTVANFLHVPIDHWMLLHDDQAIAGNLLSPAGLVALPRWVRSHDVDTDLRTGQIEALAAWARTLDPSAIHSETLPGKSGPRGTWSVDPRRAMQVAARLFGARVEAVPSIPIAQRLTTNVVVLNGTPRQGLANEAAEMLRAAGWTVWEVGNADRLTYKTSEILCRKEDCHEAGALGNVLNLSPPVLPASFAPRQSEGESSHVDYILILGQDFLDALREPGTGSP